MVHCLVAYFCLFNTLSATHFDLILEMYIEMLHMIGTESLIYHVS